MFTNLATVFEIKLLPYFIYKAQNYGYDII